MPQAFSVRLDARSPRSREDTGNRRGIPKASGGRSHNNDSAATYHNNHTAPIHLGVNWANGRGTPTGLALPLHLLRGQTRTRIE